MHLAVLLPALVAGPVLARAAARLVDGYRAVDARREVPVGAADADGAPRDTSSVGEDRDPGPPAVPGRSRAVAAAVAFAALLALAWAGGLALTGPRPAAVALLGAGAAALVLGRVDLAVHRLPDRVTYPTAAVVAAAWLADAVVLGSWERLLTAVLAAAAAFGGAALVAVFSPEGLGFGDVKLLGLLGLLLGWFGWDVLALGVLLGLAAGALLALGLLVAGRAGWRSAVPFGPPLLAGAALALALAGPLPGA